MIKQDFDIEKHVNLKSYSDSPGWLGYYERSTRFSQTTMYESIDKFIDFFRVISPNVSVVTSLYKFGSGDNEITPDQKELMEAGYLRDSLNERFSFHKGVVWEIVRELSSVMMYNAGDIAGHCFFILELLGLIVYPHDDTGFGFITMDLKQQAPKVVKSFFETLDKSKFISEPQI